MIQRRISYSPILQKRNHDVQTSNGFGGNDTNERFVHDTKHGHQVFVLILTNKLGQCSNVIEGSLSIGNSHHSVEEIDRPELR
jgi:hypothetical protein